MKNNRLVFKPCVRYIYDEGIYFGETSHTLISWGEREEEDVLKVAVMLINELLENCKLEYVGEKEMV